MWMIEYLGTDGNWYHQSILVEFFKGGAPNPDFNENATRMKHIAINGENLRWMLKKLI